MLFPLRFGRERSDRQRQVARTGKPPNPAHRRCRCIPPSTLKHLDASSSRASTEKTYKNWNRKEIAEWLIEQVRKHITFMMELGEFWCRVICDSVWCSTSPQPGSSSRTVNRSVVFMGWGYRKRRQGRNQFEFTVSCCRATFVQHFAALFCASCVVLMQCGSGGALGAEGFHEPQCQGLD